MGDFVHLHNHSHYSLQDAACTIDDLVNTAVEMNMHAIALTDHGVMFGIPEFYKKAKKAGIKPILGMEAYLVAEGSRFDKGSENGSGKKKSKHYNHLLLLAKNKVGYKNLMKLSSIAHTEGFYYKPRIDMELLKKFSEGLICTSACPAGPISAYLINNDYLKARDFAIKLHEIFSDDFYLEIQNHGLDIEKPILDGMPKLAKDLGIKLVATNDIHYINKDHSIPHNILLLLGDKTGNAEYTELRYGTDQIYFKTAEEMKRLFKPFKGAIENTLEIEEKIDVNLDFEGHLFPHFPVPPESNVNSLEEYLAQLAKEGLHKKFKRINKDIEDRLNYELDVINQMGYAGYFLVVQDFINAAKSKGIPVGPGRGSAAGSLVAYTLGITNVNPLDYNLLFERFLNPARKSMPDIDVDFADDQREEVIKYVKEKYGENSVCQIITFNRLSSKAVIRDVARVLKIPIPTVNNITKWIPSKFGRVYTIDQALEEVPELKWVKESEDEQIQNLIKYARILEGMNRNASKHAAGVVITPGDVSDFVPLAIYGDNGDVVTQYNMKELENAGLLKMDFLGLRTLSIIRDTIDLVKKSRNIEIDIENIPLDDEETYKLFWRGQTTAVFQFESAPMKEYLKKLKPTSINDLAAMNALYRPGPMEFIDDFIARKHGKKEITYLHPVLEDILKETYGIIVYQEQVIQIANKVAGMSLAEADLLRRAMGKKDLEAMKEQKSKFTEGAVKNGIDKKIAEEIFDVIDKFANYGFNKSHAVAYSIVAYQTAYLKAHFLEEFMAANLTNEFSDVDKITKLLDDCRKLRVKVLPPDINNPSVKFDVKDKNIIFGMSAIKNVGVAAVEEIVKAKKKKKGDFTSIFDFCAHVDTRIVNKRALEGLVVAGAFDSLKGTRAQLFTAIEQALDFGSKLQSAKASHAESLFGDAEEEIHFQEPSLPNVPEWESKETMAKEREVLGVYLTDHPLSKFELEYNSFANIHLGDSLTYNFNETVRACGVITQFRTKIDKSGKKMAFFKLDDLSGSCECLMFSKVYAEYENIILPESTVLIVGKLESSGDEIKLHAEEAYPLSEVRNKLTKKILITIDPAIHEILHIKKLKKIFEYNEGNIPVFVRVKENGSYRDFYIEYYKVKLTDEFISEVIELIGIEYIKLLAN
ncbi:DNA polymerase III subunit alpha [Melioribacteraceae bacterium 4301-Me]|uniref:DNA polymerase III subunit alpha n=1 Tax=Pyranulibacter aquaticus TaxID=3163344 RepID=UPI00359A7D77